MTKPSVLEKRMKEHERTFHAALRPEGLRACAEGMTAPGSTFTVGSAMEICNVAADKIETLENEIVSLQRTLENCRDLLKTKEEQLTIVCADAAFHRQRFLAIRQCGITCEELQVVICPQTFYSMSEKEREKLIKFSIIRSFQMLMHRMNNDKLILDFLNDEAKA